MLGKLVSLLFISQVMAEETYNILALDGGGIRGIITATVID